MTTIHSIDPAAAGAPPELAPLPIGALAVGVVNLLQEAADLPRPRFIAIFDTQSISVQFAPDQASLRALTRWALLFGGVVTSEPGQGKDGTETWYRTQFDYCGLAVTAYAHIPADPARTGQPEQENPHVRP